MNLKASVLTILVLALCNSAISVWYTATSPDVSIVKIAVVANALRVGIVALCGHILLSPRNRL